MGQWFETWFDSPYYPLLYQHRDYREAELFIRNLVQRLSPPQGSTFLDLGCGRGRHSVFLHQLGFDVTGMDLSAESIADAKLHETTGLQFRVGDMRQPLPGKYHYILNLFTSFGYLASDEENAAVLKNVRDALLPGGIFVLDFFNAEPVRSALPATDMQTRGEVIFDLEKKLDGKHVVKHIHIRDGEKQFRFEERVRLFTLGELQSMIRNAGMHIFETWGDYAGHTFDPQVSPRLILFCQPANHV